jgi:hypothetical protein
VTWWLALVASALVAGCAQTPRHGETVWATVAYVYTTEDLKRSWNLELAARVKGAGMSEADVAAGRLLRVACGLGPDRSWVSYAYLPPGMTARRDDILEVRIEDPAGDSRIGWNPVVGRVERFKYPGSARAYAYVPASKEQGLRAGFEQIPLSPDQRGRYEVANAEYVIKCRQGD